MEECSAKFDGQQDTENDADMFGGGDSQWRPPLGSPPFGFQSSPQEDDEGACSASQMHDDEPLPVTSRGLLKPKAKVLPRAPPSDDKLDKLDKSSYHDWDAPPGTSRARSRSRSAPPLRGGVGGRSRSPEREFQYPELEPPRPKPMPKRMPEPKKMPEKKPKAMPPKRSVLPLKAKSLAAPKSTAAVAAKSKKEPAVSTDDGDDGEDDVEFSVEFLRTMRVLARHTARMEKTSGKFAVEELENCLYKAFTYATSAGKESKEVEPNCWWHWMDEDEHPAGWKRYEKEKASFRKFYKKLELGDSKTNYKAADAKAQKWLKEQDGYREPAELGYQKPEAPRLARHHGEAEIGSRLELDVCEVRFGHNDQSEIFGRPQSKSTSILQMSVEMLSGLLSKFQIERFDVCNLEGKWYARTGNRRLAAHRLASRFAPGRLKKVTTNVVKVDRIFVRGHEGKAPKLTTFRNGKHCEGRWLFIRETGEPIGFSYPDEGMEEYGADLLSLLPKPPAQLKQDLESIAATRSTVPDQVHQPAAQPAASRAALKRDVFVAFSR
eukprot:TRINITY_DN36299_c1_g2_i4.p1 TRINITY_DN36299_c1_g2~~TRINITY_DN36299_c1_g2_i4.p1  ORF type:complete len:549 (+),score=124.50 TRINITY_DN36299_c1_g2_i4:94-1740(+)